MHRIAGPSRRRVPSAPLWGGVLVLLVAQGLALLPHSAWHLGAAGSKSPQTAGAGRGAPLMGCGTGGWDSDRPLGANLPPCGGCRQLRGGLSEGGRGMDGELPLGRDADRDVLMRLRGGASGEDEIVGDGGTAAMEEDAGEEEVDSEALLDPEKLFEALAT
ncbi:hypothetical protein T484DRAFT_1830807, partial [Baffinella frigidus]